MFLSTSSTFLLKIIFLYLAEKQNKNLTIHNILQLDICVKNTGAI